MVVAAPPPPQRPQRGVGTGSGSGKRPAATRRAAGGAIAVALLAVGLAGAQHMARSCGAGGMTSWMHGLLAVSDKHPPPAGGDCDVAVVLGYALHRNGTCTRPLQSRVEVGVDLFKQGAARHLIFSGAHPGGGLRNVSEANAMDNYAARLVGGAMPPAGRWLLEDRSTSTRTNALYSLEIIAQHAQQQQQAAEAGGAAAATAAAAAAAAARPWRSIVLVTNPFHQLRSYRTFRRAMLQAGLPLDDGSGSASSSGGTSRVGYRLYVAAAPFAGHAGYGHPLLDAAADQWDFWRELVALAWYALRGWL